MTLWNFTVDDTSPYLSYNPYSDGFVLTDGWQTWYSESGYHIVPGEPSLGSSNHITSLSNASVSLQFYGTGISLYGSSNSSFDVAIDEVVMASVGGTTSDLLYSNFNLTEGTHTVKLTTYPSNSSQQMVFDYASISSLLDDEENPPSPLFYDNSNTSFLTYSGSWITRTLKGVPNITVSAPFHETRENGASITMEFSGGTAVAVKGMADPENGVYSVLMDGMMNISNGSTSRTVPDALLFFRAGLDPTTAHHLNVTNLSDNTRLRLNSITVYKHEPKLSATLSPSSSSVSSPSAGLPLGAIVGLAIGPLLLCLFGCCLWFRRRRNQSRSPIDKPRRKVVALPIEYAREGHRVSGRAPLLSFADSTRLPFQLPATNSAIDLLSNAGNMGLTHQRSTSTLTLDLGTLGSRGRLHSASSSISCSSIHVDYNAAGSLVTDIPHPGADRRTSLTVAENIPMTFRRKPLPMIPVPSYDVALQAAQPSPDIKRMSHFNSLLDTYIPDTAPPQYEQ